MIYNLSGQSLLTIYSNKGEALNAGYNLAGRQIFPDLEPLPVPSGNLTASSIIPLPDIYEEGKGFTCTGLAYDKANNCYLAGDIGILLPNSGTIQSQIVKLSYDFSTVIGTIPLYNTFPDMRDVQGITIDTSDHTIWFCAPSENKVHHIDFSGNSIGSFSLNNATGISYDAVRNTLWVVTYNQYIYQLSKTGESIARYNWDNSDTLDQCFIDPVRNILYFVAGNHYSTANNLYKLDISTGVFSTACVLNDSYSVEGFSIESDRLVILNDGYYHSAQTAVNQANIYDLT